ncbi:MAG: YicC family protein [Lachnospiraceae bacterium]|nr:YicC family protein [Lachnospiraceae bacterium]
MVKSMTGFGRYETTGSGYRASVEIKSVNHRYCDLNIKQPKKFSAFENDIRNIVKQYATRGKIDVFISYEDYSESAFDVRYNPSVAKGYMEAIKRASEEFGIETCINSSMLVKFPDVITLEEAGKDAGEGFNIIQDAVHKACVQFVQTREREGIDLYNDIKAKLADIKELTKQIEERSPQIVAEYRQKLVEKVAELTSGTKIDEGILATEIIVFADKICVDEETVRLRSHIANMEHTMSEDRPVGRKLDFIAQEMNREANTILSKANDAMLSGLAVDLKTGIEKIREQIQNIE